MHQGSISIWFFIGVSLLVNGLLIFAAGIWDVTHPSAHPVVLGHLHAAIWWGGMLAALGAFYVAKFLPKRNGRLSA